MHILGIHFIPHSNGSAFEFMNSLVEILVMDTQNDCIISIVSAWIYDTFCNTSVRKHCILYLQKTLSEHYLSHPGLYLYQLLIVIIWNSFVCSVTEDWYN